MVSPSLRDLKHQPVSAAVDQIWGRALTCKPSHNVMGGGLLLSPSHPAGGVRGPSPVLEV